MDKPFPKGGNGTKTRRFYFTSRKGHGVFVLPKKVSKLS
ncbi:MAG: hypothetical protein GY738_09325 [Pseudoalteromonas sp.]|nr:hypothetical protein [Pseudoalteromonas sp.]